MNNCKLYLAPMEEVTTYVFRQVLDECFGGVDKYYTPFISPDQNKILKTRMGRELDPEHNKNLNTAIQVLTNNPEHFKDFSKIVSDLGYKEVNLNIGCPSGTVVKKNKGSGMLRDLYSLERFLDEIFKNKSDDLEISVKTRIGIDESDDVSEILEIYNEFPISELIVHPRYQKQFYNGKVDLGAFEYIYNNAKMPVGYNGDIKTKDDFVHIVNQFPKVSSVMIGRGCVTEPRLFSFIKNDIDAGYDIEDKKVIRKFHDKLLDYYVSEYGPNDSVFKMKEFWSYYILNPAFKGKDLKPIRKAKTLSEYKSGIRDIFYE